MDNQALTMELKREREMIEYRIAQRKNNIAYEYFGIGDDLLEAEARGVVPHGQWEQWAQETTGLGIRTVQRIMRAAREVPVSKRTGALGQLNFRQLSTVLALPDGERESMAQKAHEERMTSRELEEAIKARQQAELEAERRLTQLQEIRQRAEDAEKRQSETERQIDQLAEAKAGELMNAAVQSAQEQANEIRELKRQLADMERSDAAPDDELVQKMQGMQADLERAELYAREQARKRQEAQQQLLALQSQMARGEAGGTDQETGLTLAEFASAARAFVGKCGALPHMHAQLAKINGRERMQWESHLKMVQTLLDGARDALRAVEGGGNCE